MKLSVVIPCYNEEETVELFYQATNKILKKIGLDYEYWFIDDGSRDKTLPKLKNLALLDPAHVHYVTFSRNFGKESALYAGLKQTTGDYVTVMDADLQDPPEMLQEMLTMIQEQGYDVVGTRRVTREGEPVIRSLFARLFYKIINHISETQMVDGARDFRLMTRQVVDAILELKEVNRFSKGLFNWVGFKTTYLEYKNIERVAGESSWSFWSLLKYSLEGIINFSEAPLKVAVWTGGFSCFISMVGLIVIVIRTLIFGDQTEGWPSLACIVLFIGGLQLFCLGILGEYIGKIFLEVKKRPVYVIKEKK